MAEVNPFAFIQRRTPDSASNTNQALMDLQSKSVLADRAAQAGLNLQGLVGQQSMEGRLVDKNIPITGMSPDVTNRLEQLATLDQITKMAPALVNIGQVGGFPTFDKASTPTSITQPDAPITAGDPLSVAAAAATGSEAAAISGKDTTKLDTTVDPRTGEVIGFLGEKSETQERGFKAKIKASSLDDTTINQLIAVATKMSGVAPETVKIVAGKNDEVFVELPDGRRLGPFTE